MCWNGSFDRKFETWNLRTVSWRSRPLCYDMCEMLGGKKKRDLSRKKGDLFEKKFDPSIRNRPFGYLYSFICHLGHLYLPHTS
jgi:hypothetical protein